MDGSFARGNACVLKTGHPDLKCSKATCSRTVCPFGLAACFTALDMLGSSNIPPLLPSRSTSRRPYRDSARPGRSASSTPIPRSTCCSPVRRTISQDCSSSKTTPTSMSSSTTRPTSSNAWGKSTRAASGASTSRDCCDRSTRLTPPSTPPRTRTSLRDSSTCATASATSSSQMRPRASPRATSSSVSAISSTIATSSSSDRVRI